MNVWANTTNLKAESVQLQTQIVQGLKKNEAGKQDHLIYFHRIFADLFKF